MPAFTAHLSVATQRGPEVFPSRTPGACRCELADGCRPDHARVSTGSSRLAGPRSGSRRIGVPLRLAVCRVEDSRRCEMAKRATELTAAPASLVLHDPFEPGPASRTEIMDQAIPLTTGPAFSLGSVPGVSDGQHRVADRYVDAVPTEVATDGDEGDHSDDSFAASRAMPWTTSESTKFTTRPPR